MRGSVLGAATAHHATVALSTTRRCWRATLRADGKRRELGFEFASVAAGTLRFLLAEEDGLELVSTLLTAVFENRHRDSNQFPETSSRTEVNLRIRMAGMIKPL